MKDYIQEIKTYRGGTEVRVAQSTYQTLPARIATDIATRFALIAAIPDGEDSAGRQKLSLPTAVGLAERACDIAAALCKEFEGREWLQTLPAPKIGEQETLRNFVKETD